MNYALHFNSNNIGAIDGVDLYNFDANALPQRDVKINKLARRDLSIITSSEYSQKEIPAWMDICGGTRAQTEAVVANVKALLQPQNAELTIAQGGQSITYTVTMNEFNIEWEGNKAYVEVKFLASDPIGRGESVTLVSATGVTASPWSSNITVGGSSTAYPVINLIVVAVTGGTGAEIAIHNAKTNQGIRIGRNWVAGDILLVDSEAMNVTVNGVVVDFTGMFPQFTTGAQQIKVFDTFTTRTYDLFTTYTPKVA